MAAIFFGRKSALDASTKLYHPGDLIYEFDDVSDNIVKIKAGPRSGSKVYSDLPYMEGNVPDTGCLGSQKTDAVASFPANPNNGNWIIIENCVNSFPGQAGIAVFNGTDWQITAIPVGELVFPEPSDDNSKYFRSREPGSTNGSWVKFESVDGNVTPITIKTVNSASDSTTIPDVNELIWDSSRNCMVRGDGTTNVLNLRPFYEASVTAAQITAALGYTPENSANRGQANGYAPLGADSKVPAGFLPAGMTDTYSKEEVDAKDLALKAELTTTINNEAATARSAESAISTNLANHVNDTALHVTQSDKDAWNSKLDITALNPFNTHILDDTIHVTQADKNKWDGMNRAYFVSAVGNLPSEGNQIGNIGYVRTSADGVTPMTCDTYLWNGTEWVKYNAGGGTAGSGGSTSISFSWNDMQDKPNSTPLQIDNAISVAHSHLNKLALDKVGQTANGTFTFNGVEIGVRAVFMETEFDMPATGDPDTLYIIYEDSRVRRYPSISVWRNGAYQILGRGVQDTAQVVGDMLMLQAEFYNVGAGYQATIALSENEQFVFCPIEVLKSVAGLSNQQKIITDFTDPTAFTYNPNLISISASNHATAKIADIPAIYTAQVTEMYHHYADVDISVYKDISSIG